MIQDTGALSEVLGALIILALLLSASTIYLSQHVPKWTGECEARHAAEVPHDFAQLTADIDRAILSGDPTSTTSTPIGMIPEVVPLVGMYASGGTLRFNRSEETFECIAGLPEDSEVNGSGYWNDTANWTHFINDSFHVRVFSSHAELAPIGEEDKIVDTNESLSGEYYYDEFIVRNNSVLTVEGRLKIHATSIIVDAGSSINADGNGWSGGLGNDPGDNGSGVGGGIGGAEGEPSEGGQGGGGGGGAGSGGNGGGNSNSSGLAAFPIDEMGGGGGGGGDKKDTGGQTEFSSGGDGGSGGGRILLEAAAIHVSGTISANGTDGEGKLQYGGKKKYSGGGGGGGSGGWITIKGDFVNLSRILYATGGDGGWSDEGYGGGGGGGGAIEIFYDSGIYPDAGFINASYIDVSNGTGGSGKKEEYAGTAGALGRKAVEKQPFVSDIFHYPSGYLVSNMTAVLDQGQVGYNTNSTYIRYGNLTYGADLPPGTDMVVKVRTSMYPDMRDAVPWEDCPPVANNTDISNLFSVSDGHQYSQWRAELLTFAPERTPELYWVNITYDYGEPVLVCTSGKLEFDSQYLYYPNYQLIFAQGATIRDQRDGRFMLFEPPIFIQSTASGTQLTMTALELTGSEQTISGRVSATAKASYQAATLLTRDLNYANITLKLTTGYPSAWARWFNETCTKAGLPSGTDPGEYAMNQTEDTLQITFYGNESYPVKVWLKRAEARIELLQ